MTSLSEPTSDTTVEDTIPMMTSGTVLTMDPDTGFPNFMIINAAYGGGHSVASGALCPDEYRVFVPFLNQPDKDPIVHRKVGKKEIQEICSIDPEHPYCTKLTSSAAQHRYALTPEQIIKLAETVHEMEGRTGELLEIEWRLDPGASEFTIVKAAEPKCETPRRCGPIIHDIVLEGNPHPLLTGTAIGPWVTHGKVSLINELSQSDQFTKGDILVTREVDKSWRPLLEKAGGLITNFGGRASEAAGLCRELELPAILGADKATARLENAQEITLDCSHSETGTVYRHRLSTQHTLINIEGIPETRIRRTLSVDSPDTAQQWWSLPTNGYGMAKIERIIREDIGIHPMALIRYDSIEDEGLRHQIDLKTAAYDDRCEYFVDRLARGIAQMAAVAYPNQVVLRLNDFTSKTYAGLMEHGAYEPLERNPKLGRRGVSRYLSPDYSEAFELECQAIARARSQMGFQNISIAIPFCRTLEEARQIIAILDANGLPRGKDQLDHHLIVEVPSNIVLCQEFLTYFDRLDVDLDTLSQLILSIDPENETVGTFDHMNPAVMAALKMIVDTAHQNGVRVTVFGLLEDHRQDLMDYLISAGVDAFAFEPENFVRGSLQIVAAENLYYEEHPINPNKA